MVQNLSNPITGIIKTYTNTVFEALGKRTSTECFVSLYSRPEQVNTNVCVTSGVQWSKIVGQIGIQLYLGNISHNG